MRPFPYTPHPNGVRPRSRPCPLQPKKSAALPGAAAPANDDGDSDGSDGGSKPRGGGRLAGAARRGPDEDEDDTSLLLAATADSGSDAPPPPNTAARGGDERWSPPPGAQTPTATTGGTGTASPPHAVVASDDGGSVAPAAEWAAPHQALTVLAGAGQTGGGSSHDLLGLGASPTGRGGSLGGEREAAAGAAGAPGRSRTRSSSGGEEERHPRGGASDGGDESGGGEASGRGGADVARAVSSQSLSSLLAAAPVGAAPAEGQRQQEASVLADVQGGPGAPRDPLTEPATASHPGHSSTEAELYHEQQDSTSGPRRVQHSTDLSASPFIVSTLPPSLSPRQPPHPQQQHHQQHLHGMRVPSRLRGTSSSVATTPTAAPASPHAAALQPSRSERGAAPRAHGDHGHSHHQQQQQHDGAEDLEHHSRRPSGFKRQKSQFRKGLGVELGLSSLRHHHNHEQRANLPPADQQQQQRGAPPPPPQQQQRRAPPSLALPRVQSWRAGVHEPWHPHMPWAQPSPAAAAPSSSARHPYHAAAAADPVTPAPPGGDPSSTSAPVAWDDGMLFAPYFSPRRKKPPFFHWGIAGWGRAPGGDGDEDEDGEARGLGRRVARGAGEMGRRLLSASSDLARSFSRSASASYARLASLGSWRASAAGGGGGDGALDAEAGGLARSRVGSSASLLLLRSASMQRSADVARLVLREVASPPILALALATFVGCVTPVRVSGQGAAVAVKGCSRARQHARRALPHGELLCRNLCGAESAR